MTWHDSVRQSHDLLYADECSAQSQRATASRLALIKDNYNYLQKYHAQVEWTPACLYRLSEDTHAHASS